MNDITKIVVNGEEVILDRSKLVFSEGTLSRYIEMEGGWYDYFGAKLAESEKELADKEANYEVIYSKRFTYWKDEYGCSSDKVAEAKTKADQEVVDAKSEVIEAKLNVRLLQQHLRSWDKNHENAQSRGHFLRKEMDKLNRDIKFSSEEDLVTQSIVKE